MELKEASPKTTIHKLSSTKRPFCIFPNLETFTKQISEPFCLHWTNTNTTGMSSQTAAKLGYSQLFACDFFNLNMYKKCSFHNQGLGLKKLDLREISTDSATRSCNTAGFTMDRSKSKQQKQRYHRFYSKHSSFLSKPGAYITHNATQPLTAWSEIWVCYVSCN